MPKAKTLLEKNDFIEKKLKALQDIESKIDSEISFEIDIKNKEQNQDKGIDADLELVLEKSN